MADNIESDQDMVNVRKTVSVGRDFSQVLVTRRLWATASTELARLFTNCTVGI
jgi:hypothetical protein